MNKIQTKLQGIALARILDRRTYTLGIKIPSVYDGTLILVIDQLMHFNEPLA